MSHYLHTDTLSRTDRLEANPALQGPADSSCKCTTLEKEEMVERTRWHFGWVDSIKHHQSEGGSAFKVQVHLLIIPNNQFWGFSSFVVIRWCLRPTMGLPSSLSLKQILGGICNPLFAMSAGKSQRLMLEKQPGYPASDRHCSK